MTPPFFRSRLTRLLSRVLCDACEEAPSGDSLLVVVFRTRSGALRRIRVDLQDIVHPDALRDELLDRGKRPLGVYKDDWDDAVHAADPAVPADEYDDDDDGYTVYGGSIMHDSWRKHFFVYADDEVPVRPWVNRAPFDPALVPPGVVFDTVRYEPGFGDVETVRSVARRVARVVVRIMVALGWWCSECDDDDGRACTYAVLAYGEAAEPLVVDPRAFLSLGVPAGVVLDSGRARATCALASCARWLEGRVRGLRQASHAGMITHVGRLLQEAQADLDDLRTRLPEMMFELQGARVTALNRGAAVVHQRPLWWFQGLQEPPPCVR